MGTAMAGRSELTGVVEVEGFGEAVTPADVKEDIKAALECYLVLKPHVMGQAGGNDGGDDERCWWQVRSKPAMGAANDEDELADARTAFTATAEDTHRAMAALGSDVGSPEPAADSLKDELELVLISQGFGKVVDVED